MKKLLPLLSLLLLGFFTFAQGDPYQWRLDVKKLNEKQYELQFTSAGDGNWQLYAPNQDFGGVPTVDVIFPDSSVRLVSLKDESKTATVQSEIFEQQVTVSQAPLKWVALVSFEGAVPASISGDLQYSYGKGDEFYQGNFNFSSALEGGAASNARIKIDSINVNQPVSDCGDEHTANQSLWKIFSIGLGAGLLSLFFPCIFPLIPLTVSYFTKRSVSRRRGIINAFWYGFFIFLIFILLSLPFHVLNIQPEILNNISTNVPLNLFFFVVFIAFAISFFGYYEIVLPSSLASKTDSKAGLGDLLGIFFMALTLVIVSFSCTGPILGTLLVGALSNENGTWQLTSGMAGFGIGLGFPFVLFALFPNWLQSLPKSGGWMDELKAVFGFIELAMAVKFLSNADLVKQWHFITREVFVALWVLIGIATIAYLAGLIRFPHHRPKKFTPLRIGTIALFAAITLYLIPGLTNTPAGKLTLISGFPPPVCYSSYKHPVNCASGVEPLRNYEEALAIARRENKPLLIDFTGWACVNCRRMEENVWPDDEVRDLMNNKFVVVSLYVDERKKLPAAEQVLFTTASGDEKQIVTVGDKWATFQSENFHAVSQPQYAILSPGEKALTRTKGYTPSAREFADWLKCGLRAHEKTN